MENKKINPTAFANSLAIPTVIVFATLMIVERVAPQLFTPIYNAIFLGANLSEMYRRENVNLGESVLVLVIIGIASWVFGYVRASLYNYFSKEK